MKGKGTGKVLKSTEKDKVFVYMNGKQINNLIL